jgi:hypothetical protein
MSQQEPNEEELRAALEEQMKQIRVEDVVLQTIVTLINLGARRLGIAGSTEEAGEKDPAQAQLAIEGARALLALVDGEQLGPIRDALSQLQMAFVREAQGGDAAPSEETQTQTQTQEDEERAKARSKLWTPPGT